MSYPTLETDDLSKVIAFTATSKDLVEHKPQTGSFEGLEDVEADTAFNDGSAMNAQLLDKPNNHSELNDLYNEQVSWCNSFGCKLNEFKILPLF